MEQVVATYDYQDRYGNLLFQVVRFEPKDFRVRRIVDGDWSWGRGNITPVPYRLPQLIQNRNRVYVVEGEKDADRLTPLLSDGSTVTTAPNGAGNWKPDFAMYFQGVREVVIIPDNDMAGLKYAHTVAWTLKDVVSCIRIIHLPGVPDGGDVSDYLDNQSFLDLLWVIEMTPVLHVFVNPEPPKQTQPHRRNYSQENMDFKDIVKQNSFRIFEQYVALRHDGFHRWAFKCPFHHDTEASGKLYEDEGKWWCYGCSRGGSIIGFVMDVTGETYPEVKQSLCRLLGWGGGNNY